MLFNYLGGFTIILYFSVFFVMLTCFIHVSGVWRLLVFFFLICRPFQAYSGGDENNINVYLLVMEF